VKESEAKTKWCPMSKDSDTDCDCIASRCAVWVWDTEFFTEDLGDLMVAAGQKQSETDGHCGLAK